MTLNFEFAKKHWGILSGGLLGILVLYYLLTRNSSAASTSTAATSSDLTGTAGQVTALNTAADMTTAQVNGQIAVAQYSASVADTATAANLQASETQTAAQLAATLHGQDTTLAATENTNEKAVELQQITSGAAVAETEIQGATLSDLAHTNANAQTTIAQAQLGVVAKQIGTLMQFSKHFNSDLTAITPVLTAELGNTQASVAASQTKANADTASAAKTGAIVSGASNFLSGLFG